MTRSDESFRLPLRIVIAPQAFKGSLDATHVASSIARGVREVFVNAQLTVLPVADGGEGTVQALVRATGGRTVTTRVMGPLERPVNATWGILGGGQTGVIEMAAASGLPLIRRNERDAFRTTSYGTGELIRHALDYGVRHLIIGIGGSATNDGGAGMAQAMGARFLDSEGQSIRLGGGGLRYLDRIDVSGLDPRLQGLIVDVACDVNNPLTGPMGATYIYGPQKGADSRMVEELDSYLQRYAEIVKRDLGRDVCTVPGAGAAGGLGAGLLAFTNAVLRRGVDIVFQALKVEEVVASSDLVITGEGKIDRQDIYGKAPIAIAQIAQRFGVPCIAISGSTGRDYHVVYQFGLDALIGTVNRPMSMDRAVAESGRLISEAAMRACRLLCVGMRMGTPVGPNGEGSAIT